jgi:NADPH-dependent 2,4-dienoyl-CoA reductase/sulfur reductase-like enzyme
VAAIELIAMGWGLNYRSTPTSGEKNGIANPLVKIFKKWVKIPLIAEGRIDPVLAEKMLKHKIADFIGIGRGLLANPNLVHILETGSIQDLKPCIGCGRCIDNQLMQGKAIMCSMNPVIGQEADKFTITLASNPKEVMIVGSGPAGMETAIIAAKRGHNVFLYEKEGKFGGQINQAIIPPHKRNLIPILEFLTTQMKQAGVHSFLNQEVTIETIKQEKPDHVILASGVIYNAPPIPGIGNENVLSAKKVLDGHPVGKNIVIVGGGLIGCETAEFLSNQGKNITILEMLPDLAGKMVATERVLLLERLKHRGVKLFTSVKCSEIKLHQVTFIDQSQTTHIINADNVLIAVGDKPNLNLKTQIEGLNIPVSIVGDCLKPDGIGECIAAGYKLALKI